MMCVIGSGAALSLYFWQHTALEKLDERINLIEKRPDLTGVKDLIEAQERCALAARKTFNNPYYRLQSVRNTTALKDHEEFESVFNVKLKKCFVIIKNETLSNSKIIMQSEFLMDSIGGKTYGSYVWHYKNTSEKDDVVAPQVCKTLNSADDEDGCNSYREYKARTAQYTR